MFFFFFFFFFSSRRRHTRWTGDWSSDVCSSDLRVLDGDLYRRSDRLAGACVAERGGERHPGRRGLGRRPIAPTTVQQLVEVAADDQCRQGHRIEGPHRRDPTLQGPHPLASLERPATEITRPESG